VTKPFIGFLCSSLQKVVRHACVFRQSAQFVTLKGVNEFLPLLSVLLDRFGWKFGVESVCVVLLMYEFGENGA